MPQRHARVGGLRRDGAVVHHLLLLLLLDLLLLHDGFNLLVAQARPHQVLLQTLLVRLVGLLLLEALLFDTRRLLSLPLSDSLFGVFFALFPLLLILLIGLVLVTVLEALLLVLLAVPFRLVFVHRDAFVILVVVL